LVVSAVKLLIAGIGALISPAGLLAAALVAVGLIVIDKWAEIVKTWDSLMKTFREVCRSYMDDVLTIADAFAGFFREKFQAVKDYFKNWMKDFMTVAEFLHLDSIVDAIKQFVTDTQDVLANSGVADTLKNVGNTITTWGGIVADTAYNTGVDIAQSIAGGFGKAKDFVGGKLDAVKSVFSGTIAAPTLNVSSATVIPNIAPDAAGQASAFKTAWQSALKETAQSGLNWKTEMTGLMSSFESSFASKFWTSLQTARGVFAAIKALANNMFQAILQAFEELIAKIVAKLALYGLLDLFTGGAFGTLTGGLLKFLGFAEGGLVPGARGQAVPAIVHGGEYVLSLRDMTALSAIDTGAAVSLAGAGGGNISVSLSAPITITGGLSSDTDVRAVCEQITAAIKQGVSWGVENAKAAYKVGAKHDGEAM